MSKRDYRCENKYGDPCEFAKSNRKIPEDEVNPPMDGGNPKCPGKTESGAVCGQELIPIGKGAGSRTPGGSKLWKIALVGGGAFAILALVIAALVGGYGTEKTGNHIVFSKNGEPNPWAVYEKLEASSKILKERGP